MSVEGCSTGAIWHEIYFSNTSLDCVNVLKMMKFWILKFKYKTNNSDILIYRTCENNWYKRNLSIMVRWLGTGYVQNEWISTII